MLRLTVNGRAVEAEPGSTLLAVLEAANARVPHVCHDARLKPYGACRLCVVDIVGQPRPVASCSTEAIDGMVITTRTPELEALRKTNLELMTRHYPASAVLAEPEQPFHRLLARYGVTPGDAPRRHFHDDSHPYLGTAMDRCIHCYRCVRICDEVQGQFVWKVRGRGPDTRIEPDGDTLNEGGCVSCGACVDTCPTGALFDRRSSVIADSWTRTTCVYCGVGCQMNVGTRDGRVTQIRPAESPVNHGHLCVKGRYAWEFATAPDRITTPMIRQGGAWQPATWDQALDFTAKRLTDIRARSGPDAIGVLGSARATNEENYLIQKFARVVLGTNNVDCCARVCHTPSAKALKTMLGTGAATNSFDDIEKAAGFLVCGCNPTENHPIVGARIKQQVLRGAKLIVVDPRRIEMAEYADIHLALRPGSNVPLFHAMAATIIEEGLVDPEFLRERVTGFDDFTRFIRDFAPEAVAETCGVPAEELRAAARMYATVKPTMCCHGLGMTEHLQGTEGVMGLINLALLTGNLGRPGAGINPLRGQNNVQGAAVMGCEPNSLPGSQSIPKEGPKFAAAWGAPIPASHGLNLLEMIDSAGRGELKAIWAFGYDMYLTLANVSATGAAMANLELVIIQDLFMNETARAFGTVFLPAASFLEREGTFMNADRRVQRVRKAVEAPGEARPDAWIIQELARRMGHPQGFSFESSSAVWDEVRRLWPAVAGLPYRRLENESLQWPCPTDEHPGTPVMHQDRFAAGKTAALERIPFVPSPETCDEDFPLMLITGRRLYHFNAGTMTYRTPNRELEPEDTLDIHPEDARRLDIVDGQRVRIRSRYGEAVLILRLTDRMKPGELFTSFHRPELWVNQVTSPVRDRLTSAPEYKLTAVRLEGRRPGT